jgi:hypothetical protein
MSLEKICPDLSKPCKCYQTLEFHAESGMALLVKVGNNTDLPAEPVGWPQCGNFFYNNKK